MTSKPAAASSARSSASWNFALPRQYLLPTAELPFETKGPDLNHQIAPSPQAHLDLLILGVPPRHVIEVMRVDVSIEFASQDVQHVFVKGGRDPCCVVIGRHEPFHIFHQVGAEQEVVARIRCPVQTLEDAARMACSVRVG